MPHENEAPALDAETRRRLQRSAVRTAEEAIGLLELAAGGKPCPDATALRGWCGRLWLESLAGEPPEAHDLARAELLLEQAADGAAALYGTDRGAGVLPLLDLARLRRLQGREAEAMALEERFTAAVANDERERRPPEVSLLQRVIRSFTSTPPPESKN